MPDSEILSPDQAARRADDAEREAARLEAEALEAKRRAAAAVAGKVEAVRREAARVAHLDACKAEFLKKADTLAVKKCSSPADYAELANAILAAQTAFFRAAEQPAVTENDKLQVSIFYQRVTNANATARILLWLTPLLHR